MCTQRDNNPGNVYTITQAMCTQQPRQCVHNDPANGYTTTQAMCTQRPRQCVHNDPANGYTTTQTMFKIIPLVKLYISVVYYPTNSFPTYQLSALQSCA